MFSRYSPLKRKHNEYHDPDYPQPENLIEEDDSKPGCSIHLKKKRRKSGEDPVEKPKNENYLNKVRQVIEREFQRELVIKQQQLEEIDERLDKAKHLLDRLRYGIVAAYYKKQEIPLTAADAATVRGPNSLFEREDKGPQMPLHPSIKKLIGKRPKDLSEVIRTCPKRMAAKNAVQTIRAKSQVQKREERKLKQIIREQGIVIDHSKQNTTENDVNSLLNAAAQNSLNSQHDLSAPIVKQVNKIEASKVSGKSLNAARLNNKIKHLIVVGNTSKYIGNEVERDTKDHTQNITHKWLVYVQSKENKQPIERFVEKVRFHLHHSYRPNDVVDIESPPFQVSRRGWGEFPVRVQLFFHSEFHQKPVQLVHNIILDQTFSGIQTLGAETLLEIWLREVTSTSSANKEIKVIKKNVEAIKKLEIPTKLKANLMTRTEELVDDNLLDFLNKIEASPSSISADIEKIQPTVLVTEPLGVRTKTPSPEKCKVIPPTQKSPNKMTTLSETPKCSEKSITMTPTTASNTSVSVAQSPTSVAVATQFKSPLFTNSFLASKPMTFVRLPTSSKQIKFVNNTATVTSNITQIPPLTPITRTPAPLTSSNQTLPTTTIPKPSIMVNKDGKILMPSASVASAVRRTILPIVNNTITNMSNPTSQTPQFSAMNKSQFISVPSLTSPAPVCAPKQMLQKKLVQLVDSTGKVKYIQMFVAASSALSGVHNSVSQKLATMAPSALKNNIDTKTTQITNTITTPFVKAPNGAHLMPAMTMKPNIFKIIPESMQTKPQILTFSTTTVVASNTNTPTTANTQKQPMQISVSTTTRTTQLASLSPMENAKPINITLPVANKLQKLNSNNTTTTAKNLVFQREGKLYLIDPQQIKYKQQQNKRVSLLKPQISLLKQQQLKHNAPTATASNIAADTIKSSVAIQNNAPQLHFGLKQQRINSINGLQLLQMKRVLFEKQFLRQEFTNMRSAVEFLLRRLKLVVSKDSLVFAFPFVSHTLQEFQSLTAFKQRACEWLRAKQISRMLRNHKDLQRLNSSSKEAFWSTKEIATFARHFAYTPPIKSLPRPGELPQTEESNTKGFMDLVKSELKQDQNLQYDTLTGQHKVRKWVDKVWNSLEDYKHHEDQHQIIDIDNIQEKEQTNYKKNNFSSNTSFSNMHNSLDTYLAPPPHLENQCELVTDICKDLNIKLAHEELDKNMYHPSMQTVLAQCLHLFIEKLLRQSLALKQENSTACSAMESICTILPQDLAKVMASNNEFDFLTNNNFGSPALLEGLESSVKQENP